MGKFKFGNSSLRRMQGANSWLTECAVRALDLSTDLDFGVGPYGGLRTAEEQNSLFKKGNSRCDGYTHKSYHQSGKALDLVPYINGKFTWEDKEAFIKISKLMFQAWDAMIREFGELFPPNTYLHWGGYWRSKDLNGDGKITGNEIGWDGPHFELRPTPQKHQFYRAVWKTGYDEDAKYVHKATPEAKKKIASKKKTSTKKK